LEGERRRGVAPGEEPSEVMVLGNAVHHFDGVGGLVEWLQGTGGVGHAAEQAERGECARGGVGLMWSEPEIDMARVGAHLLVGVDGAPGTEGRPCHLLYELVEASAHRKPRP